MPADKPRPTLADYVTIALSPALIVAMIVSLVFFLVTVLYRGEFVGRLQYILFFFVFGMVLIARIAMETAIAERAPVYGGVLAFVVWIAMGRFVSYPPELEGSSWLINAGLVALVWWLAYRLTYSCTYIDEKAEATGRGVLQAAGLDADAGRGSANPGESSHGSLSPLWGEGWGEGQSPRQGDSPSPPAPLPKRARGEKEQPVWRERYQRFREEQKKTQPPGVWVVYFALAALPIYGLGQALIDVDDVERRGFSFWLMALYVASSLGLLVTTSFLGLRRYLRQRKLQMPAAMAGAWLAVGGGLLVAFVLIGALLPRPQAEFSILNLTPAGSKPRDASSNAVGGSEPGQGEGRPGAQERDAKGAPVDSKDPKREGQGGKGQAKGQGAGAKGEQKGSSKDAGKQADDRATQAKQDGQETRPSSGDPKSSRQGSSTRSGSRSWFSEQPWLAKIATALKWIVFVILALATVAFVLRGGLGYLANFADWARRLLEALRRFWHGLFGAPPRDVVAEEAVAVPKKARRPFDAFSNPFLDGRADGMLPPDLVRYSFEGLEAWALQRQLGRGAEETPIEFTERIGKESPGLAEDVKRLGALYARVLYARGALPPSWRPALEAFWERLGSVPEAPLAA